MALYQQCLASPSATVEKCAPFSHLRSAKRVVQTDPMQYSTHIKVCVAAFACQNCESGDTTTANTSQVPRRLSTTCEKQWQIRLLYIFDIQRKILCMRLGPYDHRGYFGISRCMVQTSKWFFLYMNVTTVPVEPLGRNQYAEPLSFAARACNAIKFWIKFLNYDSQTHEVKKMWKILKCSGAFVIPRQLVCTVRAPHEIVHTMSSTGGRFSSSDLARSSAGAYELSRSNECTIRYTGFGIAFHKILGAWRCAIKNILLQ